MTRPPRRGLTAVMFADIVGFTALMGRDEVAAREQRDRQRSVVERAVQSFGGEVKQFYGDGTLSVFASAVEASRCAVAIQDELRRPPEVLLRIGIHVGDVVDEGDGVYGDGVNVAARVESLAPAGGIAVSDKVFDEIKNHRDLAAVSMGKVRLKNVSRPVEVFALTGPGLPQPDADHVKGLAASAEDLSVRSPWGTLAAAVAAIFVLAFGLLWLSGRFASGPPPQVSGLTDRTRPSIAVLPFRNLSEESENAAFFADGIHDDILTQLAKVSSMEVIARTSVMRYAGSDAPVPEIGRELGVATILEGGVQRAGNRVRLNVQLIDAETDAHLWAETYDRELNAENVFAIQSEVAQAIARELRAVISGDERGAMSGVPTANLAAYDLYLLGSAAMRRNIGQRDLEIAEEAFQEAVAIDPGFVLAFARLAYVHLDEYWNVFDRTPERLRLAREALRRAEALDPRHPEVLIARGYYEYWGRRDYTAAQRAFAAAERAQPGDARLHEARGYVLRRVGQWDDAVLELREAMSLDPLNSELVRGLGETHLILGDYEIAQELLNRALAVDPERWTARFDLGRIGLLRDGAIGPMKEGFVAVDAGLGDRNSTLAYWGWWVPYVEGDDSGAFSDPRAMPPLLEMQAAIYPRALLNALMHHRMGRREEAMPAADSARLVLEGFVAAHPLDPRGHATLGIAHALMAHSEEAVREGETAVELLPVGRDAMDGPEYLVHLARIHALLGHDNAALSLIDEVLSVPSLHTAASLRLEPAFAALRDHPRLATN